MAPEKEAVMVVELISVGTEILMGNIKSGDTVTVDYDTEKKTTTFKKRSGRKN